MYIKTRAFANNSGSPKSLHKGGFVRPNARRQHGTSRLFTVEPGDAESRLSALSDDQTALMDFRLNRLAAATGHPHANGAEGVNDSGRVLFRVPSTRMKGDIFLSGQVRATSPAVWIDFLTSPVARAEVPARPFKILQCETETASKLIAPSFPLLRPHSCTFSTVVDFRSWFKLPDCPRPSFKAAVACARWL
ncbi:hypothetical protein NEUTE2DRAFT_132649 [Neurospora tetrasperma FGSC 2509]|nr:hypothetical protein NEUTE2DRAFT_132649 [Neurospora tetrasperma FGSC 2509]